MFFFYQILFLIIIFFSPVIIIIRLLKNKEDRIRFLEKFTINLKKRKQGNLIWFHAASVGEFLSIVPLIKKLEKNRNIKNILISTSTLSSSKIFENFKFKKTIHQFFPIDFGYFTSKFIYYWKPKIAIFIDSEIWPCMFNDIKKNSIPLLLMNARITKKSFLKWNFFENFSKDIFKKIDVAYPANNETEKYLKKFKVKKIKNIGNLKFSDDKDINREKLPKSFLITLKKRLIWVASSTHPTEEILVGKTHVNLKKRFKNLLTIIIPRHINRVSEIKDDLSSLGLKIIVRSSKKKINSNTDIYLVDTYGETRKFFKIAKMIFIGGSIVNHGGQNPIEPARYGLNIVHGPNVGNFKEIFKLFRDKRLAFKINNQNQLNMVAKKLLTKKNKKKIDLKKLGENILEKTVLEINQIFNDETKKT